MSKQMELSEETKILMAAREALEKGWCQGALRTIDGKYCLSGAILLAGGGFGAGRGPIEDDRLREKLSPSFKLVTQAVGLGKGKSPGWSIPMWNDVPGRTREEVLAAMDRAIALSMGVPELTVA